MSVGHVAEAIAECKFDVLWKVNGRIPGPSVCVSLQKAIQAKTCVRFIRK